MLESPVGRCFGIGVLLIGLGGLFVLGSAGWSLDAAVAEDSSGIDEIGMYQSVDLDAEYRDSTLISSDQSSAVDSSVTAGVGNDLGIAEKLFKPSDPSKELHITGIRYLYFISLVGAALVSIRD